MNYCTLLRTHSDEYNVHSVHMFHCTVGLYGSVGLFTYVCTQCTQINLSKLSNTKLSEYEIGLGGEQWQQLGRSRTRRRLGGGGGGGVVEAQNWFLPQSVLL